VYIDFPTGDDNQEPEWFKKERSVEEHNQPAALYDLAEDPQEKKNLIAVYPEKAKELKLLLEKYQYEGHSVPSGD
jgi:arylsulfatase A-like enzyme